MNYSDTIEQSSEYLRMALDHMGRHRIPVDPENYSVWYEYVSGRNEPLKLVIDDVLSKTRSVTPELNKSLYEKYVATDYKQIIKKIRIELRKVLDTILNHVVDTGGELTRFSTMINIYSQRLKDDLDAEAIQKVVEDILVETDAINRSGLLLKERIVASTREIESLRTELEKVKMEATTDALTGLRNRRYLETNFGREAEHALKTGSDLSLIMCDLDHFKRINDRYGHLIGDRVLRTSARMLIDCVKGRDIVIRYGGEEFVIVLPETPLKGAIRLAEHICTYFKTMNWKRKDTEESIGHVHVSLGVSQYRHGESLKSLIARADKALYLAKVSGRCRVTSEEDVFKLDPMS